MLSLAVGLQPADCDALRKALTFHASFDGGTDGVQAAGDPKLYWAPTFKQRGEAKPGLPPTGEIVTRRAQAGSATRCASRRRSPRWCSSGAAATCHTRRRLERHRVVLAEGRSRRASWNPASATRSRSRRERVERRARSSWNSRSVLNRSRSGSASTRISTSGTRRIGSSTKSRRANGRSSAWTSRPFRPASGRTSCSRSSASTPAGRTASARLYLDAQARGTLGPRPQVFTWDPEKVAIALGLGYIGLLDELTIFSRALTDEEVRTLHSLDRGVTALLR